MGNGEEIELCSLIREEGDYSAHLYSMGRYGIVFNPNKEIKIYPGKLYLNFEVLPHVGKRHCRRVEAMFMAVKFWVEYQCERLLNSIDIEASTVLNEFEQLVDVILTDSFFRLR